MFEFTAHTLTTAVGGRLLAPVREPSRRYTLSTDSRSLKPGQIFVALRGDRFDGHEFLEDVLRHPATGALGLEPPLRAQARAAAEGRVLIAVDDPLFALGEAARAARASWDFPLVVGLTGTAGKTSTKDLLRAVLSPLGPGLATEGNLNNLIGLPLTVLKRTPEQRWAVLEMGMNAPGEIARLAEIAAPTVRLITNVGVAHTEGLGGIDGVARAKGELFASARAGDRVIVNADDPLVRALPVPPGVERVTFGSALEADVRLLEIRPREDGTSSIRILHRRTPEAPVELEAHVPLLGEHNAYNALAAVAVALSAGMRPAEITAGLATVTLSPMRMAPVVLPSGALLINDAYNANPTAMEAALCALVRQARLRGRQSRAAAVLGDMLELGALEQEAHRTLGARVAELGIERLFAVGSRAGEIAAGALAAGMPPSRVWHGLDPQEAATALNTWLTPTDVTLIKGSRGARMERVIGALLALSGDTDRQQALETGAH